MMQTICAVVVTYNRLNLLKECIGALRNQTRKLDEIIVVNNDSTDGTKEWLEEQKDLTKIHQENLGGAGGFHNGMKAAYEKGHDWIWLMDDDCLAKNTALSELMIYANKGNAVLNSLIINIKQHNLLNFGLYDYINGNYFETVEQIESLEIINGAGFFNGSLFPRATISDVGFPKMEFFIYGDEYEYFLRIINRGLEIRTIVKSIVYHPSQSHKNINLGKFRYRFIYFTNTNIKYIPRNLLCIAILYKEFRYRRLIKTYVFDLYGIIFIQKKILFLFKYIKSIISGMIFYSKLNKTKQ